MRSCFCGILISLRIWCPALGSQMLSRFLRTLINQPWSTLFLSLSHSTGPLSLCSGWTRLWCFAVDLGGSPSFPIQGSPRIYRDGVCTFIFTWPINYLMESIPHLIRSTRPYSRPWPDTDGEGKREDGSSTAQRWWAVISETIRVSLEDVCCLFVQTYVSTNWEGN